MTRIYDLYADAPTSILLVDAHHLLRIGVATLIDAEPDLWVAAQAAKSDDIQGLIERYKPELVLADLKTLEPDPATVIARTRASAKKPHVVILSHLGSEVEMMRTMQAGAQGYFLKNGSPHDLLRCLRSARNGELYRPQPSENAAAALSERSALSPRELHILTRVASGHSNRRIASAFGMSDSTTRSVFGRIFDKLGVDNRCSAVATAVQRGLIGI